MRRTAAGLVLAVLLVAAVGAGYLAVNSGRQGSSSMSTSQSASTSTSSVEELTNATSSGISTSGLELRVELNSTTMLPGQTLVANVTLFNTLNQSLSLPLSAPANRGGQIMAWNNYDYVCGIGGIASIMLGFVVFKGHFSTGNINQAPTPLQLWASFANGPPCNGLVSAGGVTFRQDSDVALIGGTLPGRATLNVTTANCIAVPQCHGGSGLFGYWSNSTCCPVNFAPRFFRYLTPGEYTIAAEDLWNQTAYAYFVVSNGPSPSQALAAQESPFSGQNSPIVGLTLANLGSLPIVSLNATISFLPPEGLLGPVLYPFTFEVNSSVPLQPGQTVQQTRTLSGPLFDIGVGSYPLTIDGTLSNGTTFSYIQQIQFTNSVPSW